MEQIDVDLGERSYPIYIGAGLFNDPAYFSQLIKLDKSPVFKQNVVVISNVTVAPLYADQIVKQYQTLGCQVELMVLPDGEQYKNLSSFENILSFMLERNLNRDVLVVALGGGVIGDLVGFSAASYQRGVQFVQIPTTLLSQVDSSVGGKTAVNHTLGKNMIGAFYQPKSVIIDIDCLNSLPEREFSAGMAEVIKYGIMADASLFTWLENNVDAVMSKNIQALTHIIARCCQIKADVVAKDEKESASRALLNLGHTFGHAIEAELGYGNWLHGEAVAAGTMMAARVALAQGALEGLELQRIEALLLRAKLPVHTPETMSYEDFMRHMLRDKKVLAGQLRLVLPVGIGKAQVVSGTPESIIKQAIDGGRVTA